MSKTDNSLTVVLHNQYEETIDVCLMQPGLKSLLATGTRASHRCWAPDKATPSLTRLLAVCALPAPFKSYLQQTDIIDVSDASQRITLTQLKPSKPWLAEASVLVVFCGNGCCLKRLFDRTGEPLTNDHLDVFFNPTVDASIVMLNFINAASAAGLVSCSVSKLRNHVLQLAEILELSHSGSATFCAAGARLSFHNTQSLTETKRKINVIKY